MVGVLVPLIVLAFYVLFGTSFVAWRRHRGPVEFGVLLVFGSTAALFAISFLNTELPALATYLSPLAIALLVAQPVFMLRLARLFAQIPRTALPVVAGGSAISVVLFYASSRATWAVLFLVGWFVMAEFVAAAALFGESRRRRGFPRARLATASLGSALFGISILVSGAASAARGGAPSPDAVLAVTRLLALAAALSFLVAFAPPAWLRRIAYRAVALDLVRSTVGADAGGHSSVLWRSLADTAGDVLTADRVRILATDGAVLAESEIEPLTPERRHDVSIPIELDGERAATMIATIPGRPLFLADDVALIQLLGSLTARSAEREDAVTKLADAAAVRASEARLRAVLDADPNGVFLVDADGTIRWATPAAARTFGLAPEEVEGRRIDDLVAPMSGVSEPVASLGSSARYESTATGSDGRTFPVEVATSPYPGEGESLSVVAVTDISWRKEEAALREQFIGVLSHELRTPITAIYGGSRMLVGRRDMDAGTHDELLSDIAGEAERLMRIVENLLILAKVERHAEVVEPAPILLQRTIPELIARERELSPSLKLVAEMADPLPPVLADDASIALILRNFISNATKYAGPEASVRLCARSDDHGTVSVTVSDDGPGVDDAEVASLFDLYYRSKRATSAAGSGIGLFVCRKLIEAMGGRIWAGRSGDGGAEFGFSLPAYTEDADIPEAFESPPPSAAPPFYQTATA